MTLLRLALLEAAGLFNDTALVSDPSGTTLGLDLDMLPSRRSWDYRPPGAVVLLAFGIASLLCLAALLLDVLYATCGVRMIGVVTIAGMLFQIIVLDIDAPRAYPTLGLAATVRPQRKDHPGGDMPTERRDNRP